MPGFDRTGPQGQGAMSGRRLGKCTAKKSDSTKEDDQRFSEERPGRGMAFGRRGRGRGFGRRNRFMDN